MKPVITEEVESLLRFVVKRTFVDRPSVSGASTFATQ